MSESAAREEAQESAPQVHVNSRSARREVAAVFLRLGLTAFGGPAAHIAAMEDELVTRRRWLSRGAFVDLVGATNLIPGPNSTELAIHLGYLRAGRVGLLLAGACFLVPAVLLVWLAAWAYVRYGTRVEVAALLQGMQPAVLAVVVQALWRLKASVMRTSGTLVLALVALAAALAGVSEFAILGGALLVGALNAWRATDASNRSRTASGLVLATGGLSSAPVWSLRDTGQVLGAAGAGAAGAGAAGVGAGTLFVSFATIGSVLFGSGYVLLAFVRREFVERLGVLTDAQALDAIALGQVTPGPVFSAATFVGYVVDGHIGAMAATAGIFLPAFVAVALSAPLVHRLQQWPAGRHLLDAVNAASLALMAAVVVMLARALGMDLRTLAILLVASLVLIGTRVGSGWVLLGGAVAGLLLFGGVTWAP
jgi:chromate transporter